MNKKTNGKDYAEMRASVLRDLDGLRYEVDTAKKLGWLWLDRPPLNILNRAGARDIGDEASQRGDPLSHSSEPVAPQVALSGARIYEDGLEMKRALDDQWGTAVCLRHLGLTAYDQGEYGEARRLLSESLTLSRAMGSPWSIASTARPAATR